MDLSGIIFLGVGLLAIIVAYVMEGGGDISSIKHLFEITAILIVFGGTVGAVGLSFPIHVLKTLPGMIKKSIAKDHDSPVEIILTIRNLCNKARKEGIISLEEEVKKNEDLDPFLKRGINLIVDGTDPEVVKTTLEIDMDSMSARHKAGIEVFAAAGGFAPTMGVVGTVMGLVHVLGNLDDTSTLGPKIAVAFIATLYGVGSANLLFLPLGSRLKEMNKEELEIKTMMMDGIFSILTGESASVLVEKLKGYLTPAQRIELEEKINAK